MQEEEVKNQVMKKVLEFHRQQDAPEIEKEEHIFTEAASMSAEEMSTLVHTDGVTKCWDDVKGGWLKMTDVIEARKKELQYIHRYASQKLVSLPILKTDYFQNGEINFEHCLQIQKI